MKIGRRHSLIPRLSMSHDHAEQTYTQYISCLGFDCQQITLAFDCHQESSIINFKLNFNVQISTKLDPWMHRQIVVPQASSSQMHTAVYSDYRCTKHNSHGWKILFLLEMEDTVLLETKTEFILCLLVFFSLDVLHTLWCMQKFCRVKFCS